MERIAQRIGRALERRGLIERDSLLATDPDALTHVLGIVYRAISGFILEKAGLTLSYGRRRQTGGSVPAGR